MAVANNPPNAPVNDTLQYRTANRLPCKGRGYQQPTAPDEEGISQDFRDSET